MHNPREQSLHSSTEDLNPNIHHRRNQQLHQQQNRLSVTQRRMEKHERELRKVLKAIADSVEKNDRRLHMMERKDKLKREWQKVAIVVDRLLLIIFVLLTVGVTLGLLFKGTVIYTGRSSELASKSVVPL